jgi:uncharacterized protein YaiL (DUF2058 family)
MTKQEMLDKAERNLRKAEIAFHSQFNRPGITEKEKENLSNNVEYATFVRNLIEMEVIEEENKSIERAYGNFREQWEYELEG